VSAPVLFLHAFGGAGRDWDAVRRRLPDALRGDAPDLPGFGGAPDLPETSFDGYVDWVAARVGRAPGGAHLVAHSMSGKLALALAARRPGLVASLVLVAPSTPGAEPMGPHDRAHHLARFGDPEAARRAVLGSAHALPPEALDTLVKDRLAVSRRAWDWWMEAGSLLDVGPEMAGVAAPVHVVAGAQDAALGEAAQRRHLLPRLAHGPVHLHIVSASGHFVPLERPDALAAVLRETLACEATAKTAS
jgi:pimeloyl-ACP methyl ester carboxylesterase